ncbi:MAG: YgjV family protein [Oscillospiraceae bacterium]|nr:YgjV family protein [Oscillospiraceae bacterium]
MELTSTYIFSQVLIIGAYALMALTYYSVKRQNVLFLHFLASILTGGSLLLLNAYTGVAMTVVAIFRNFVFWFDEKKYGKSEKIYRKDWILLAVIFFAILVGTILTYDTPICLLVVFVTIFFTFSIWQKKTIVYKIMAIPIALLFIMYNIYIQSLFGAILEGMVLIFATTGFMLELRKKDKI